MNVLFLVSANKTKLFLEISKNLVKKNKAFFWISPSRNWFNFLIKNGVNKDQILCLPDLINIKNKDELTQIELTEISTIEEEIGDSFHNIVLMDRILRKKNNNLSFRIMLQTYKVITDFLQKKSIDVSISEQTWNFELLTNFACNALNIKSFYVDGTKVPDGRFSFFQGSLLNKIYLNITPKEGDYEFARKFIQQYREEPKPVSYLKSHFASPTLKISLISKLVNHIGLFFKDREDLTRRNIYALIEVTLIKFWNYSVIKFKRNFYIKNIPKDFILITLHKVPDSAVDVAASKYFNQLEAIRAFIRIVPTKYHILIKDHSHGLGLTSFRSYNELLKGPNVHFVDPDFDFVKLMSKALLVYSISGTSSLEASIMGKKAIISVERFWSEILASEAIDPYTLSSEHLLWILQKPKVKDSYLIEYIAKIYANSYKGLILDPIKSRDAATCKNIQNLSKGFESFLNERV